MFKKIYVEITNNCNLNCDFCIKNSRKIEYINIGKFKILLNKLTGYTEYLYFHLLGEPLIHPNINELIDVASNNYKINITTNGYLINKVKNNKNIRQINISLHSYNPKYGITLDKYLDNIFDSIDILKQNTYISLRIWINSEYNDKIISKINDRYNTNLKIGYIKNNTTITKNIFISINEEFIWPSLENDIYYEEGTCYGLIDHIGILVDGTVVPCCLDSKGDIDLGNIYKDNLDEIINTDRCKKIVDNFKCNIKTERLCKKCKFM